MALILRIMSIYNKGREYPDNNPMMKLLRERKEKEFKEKYLEYNQWFIDRKIGGSAYDDYMENAIKNAKNNQKLLEEIGAKFQINNVCK